MDMNEKIFDTYQCMDYDLPYWICDRIVVSYDCSCRYSRTSVIVVNWTRPGGTDSCKITIMTQFMIYIFVLNTKDRASASECVSEREWKDIVVKRSTAQFMALQLKRYLIRHNTVARSFILSCVWPDCEDNAAHCGHIQHTYGIRGPTIPPPSQQKSDCVRKENVIPSLS